MATADFCDLIWKQYSAMYDSLELSQQVQPKLEERGWQKGMNNR